MITGHRPKSMQWSYNLEDPKRQVLSAMLENILINTGCSDAWTGMALGADTVFAKAVIALKNRGCLIRLHCAIPRPVRHQRQTGRGNARGRRIRKLRVKRIVLLVLCPM